MPVKQLVHPVTGKTVRLGRNRSSDPPKLRLKDYIRSAALPTPPVECDYSPAASQALAQMYENQNLGDCVVACMGHIQGIWTGNAGDPVVYTDTQVIAEYGACGYVPGDPSTDNGCYIDQMLAYWKQHGFPSGSSAHTILGYLGVDPSNPIEFRTALYLFENLILGLELPDAWITPFPSASGFAWDVAGSPDPQNGHCVGGCGYTTAGVKIATWAMTGTMTDAAIAEYCSATNGGDLYVAISEDALSRATDRAPNGLDWEQLAADFRAMGGTLPSGLVLNRPLTAADVGAHTWKVVATDQDGVKGTIEVSVKIS